MFTVEISVTRASFREEVSLYFHGYAGDLEAMSASTGFMPFHDALELLSAIIVGRSSIRGSATHHFDLDVLSVSVRSMIGGSSFEYAVGLEDGLEAATNALHEVLRLKAGK